MIKNNAHADKKGIKLKKEREKEKKSKKNDRTLESEWGCRLPVSTIGGVVDSPYAEAV
jgi:hypothetical protein